MMTSAIDSLNATFQKTHQWLTELMQIGAFHTEPQAYSALRAVLHTLRDRLTVDEAAHLSAQLPMLVRGFYFEGWKPAATPVKYRTKQEFLAAIASQLGNAEVDPQHACTAVFGLLSRKISGGEVMDIRHMLPAEVRELWETSPPPRAAARERDAGRTEPSSSRQPEPPGAIPARPPRPSARVNPD